MRARVRSFGARRVAGVVLAAGLFGVAAVPSILAASAPLGLSTSSAAGGQAAAVAGSLDDVVAAPDRTAARPGRILRGDATLLKRDGTTMTVHFERGEISAASAASVTIKGADGVSTTFAIGPSTRIRSAGQASTADALAVGSFAAAVGTPAGSGYDALLVRVRR